MTLIREPHVAGMFYPSDPQELQNQIKSYLREAKVDLKAQKVAGLISPHAGYIYSGKTAAYGYKTIMNKKYKTVFVISPSHREYFHGVSIYSGDAYKTPLGVIPVNKELREQLVNSSEIIHEGIEGHRAEHALEVQLPFLQLMLKDFELVPIVIGDQRKEFIYDLADAISKVIDDDTLIVASSDLSHFYSKTQAQALDSRIVNHLNHFNFEELQNDLENKRCEACGGGGIVALLKSLKNKSYSNIKVVSYSDSSDVTGDESEVVGYLSAVIYN